MTMSPAEVLSVVQMAQHADLVKYGSIEWYCMERWKQFYRVGWYGMVGGDEPSQSDDESDLNNWAL